MQSFLLTIHNNEKRYKCGDITKNRPVYYDYLDIYDDKVFTHERVNMWKSHLCDCYEDVYKGLKAKLDYSSPINFNLSISMLDEVLVDAVIGMRKVVTSDNNSVEDPNTFKIAAYLSYWWLRHKPVYLHYPIGFRLEAVEVKEEIAENVQERERLKKELCWQLKHINELVAVQIVSTYIFNFEREICGRADCRRIKSIEKDKFRFANFDEMRDDILKKLTYYFSYRAIAPKVIEHMLEAYTFHPAWDLTGTHWGKGDD